jgi:hypothetical protein
MHPTHSTQQRTQPPFVPMHSMQTRGKDGIVVPKRHINLSATETPSPLLHTYRQALKDPNWHNAMTDEHNALMTNNTRCLVPKPAGVNVVTGTWIFCYKYNLDGSLARYKARWVVCGCSQKPGIDYGETFSPVIKPATIRTVLSISTSSNWPIHQLDVKNGFIHGSLKLCIVCNHLALSMHPNHLMFAKSLYGLKQAPRTWFLHFKAFLLSIGYHASKADSSLFILHTSTATSYILLYVDGIILTAGSTSLLHLVIQQLHSEFAMKDLGPLSHFLGIHLTPTPSGIFL